MMGIIDNAKEVAELIKKVGDIELYRKIVELEGEIIEQIRENRKLEERVAELEGQLNLKIKMVFGEPFYYQEGDKTPYCPRCWEAIKRAVHLFRQFTNEETTRWDCPDCKQMYLVERGRGGYS